MTSLKTVLLCGLAGLAMVACSPATEAPAKPQTEVKAAPAPAPKVEPAKVEVPKVEEAKVEAPAATPAPAAAPKPMSAKRLYTRRTCMACHGREGARGIQDYPNIAGLDAAYIRTQMKDILSGKRTGSADDLTGAPRTESMRGALVTAEGEVRISPTEISTLAKWLSAFPKSGPQVHEPALSAERIAEGEAAYKKGKCQTCHGPAGNRPLKGYPHLAGQKSAYMLAQLIDVREGVRTNARSRMMLPFVKKLTDEEMAVIADYLSQVDPNL